MSKKKKPMDMFGKKPLVKLTSWDKFLHSLPRWIKRILIRLKISQLTILCFVCKKGRAKRSKSLEATFQSGTLPELRAYVCTKCGAEFCFGLERKKKKSAGIGELFVEIGKKLDQLKESKMEIKRRLSL